MSETKNHFGLWRSILILFKEGGKNYLFEWKFSTNAAISKTAVVASLAASQAEAAGWNSGSHL